MHAGGFRVQSTVLCRGGGVAHFSKLYGKRDRAAAADLTRRGRGRSGVCLQTVECNEMDISAPLAALLPPLYSSRMSPPLPLCSTIEAPMRPQSPHPCIHACGNPTAPTCPHGDNVQGSLGPHDAHLEEL